VEEDKDWLIGGVTGCRSPPPRRNDDPRLTGVTPSPYRTHFEWLTEIKERNTDSREPEVVPTAVLMSAFGVEGVFADD